MARLCAWWRLVRDGYAICHAQGSRGVYQFNDAGLALKAGRNPKSITIHKGARTRSGTPCPQPAMANGRCRVHGGKSTAPRKAEGLDRMRAALTIHGRATEEAVAFRRQIAELNREARFTRGLLKGMGRVRPVERTR